MNKLGSYEYQTPSVDIFLFSVTAKLAASAPLGKESRENSSLLGEHFNEPNPPAIEMDLCICPVELLPNGDIDLPLFGA